MSTPATDPWVRPFIANLRGLLGEGNRERDSAALAKLRRGLTGHTGERDIWVYGHLHGARPVQEESAALVASLFAVWHQGGRGGGRGSAETLGGSFRQLREALDSASIENRFAALLDSHLDDLPVRLRHAITLLKSKDVPIDWEQLLDDLLRWDTGSRSVQRRWARDFWAGGRFSQPTNSGAMTIDPTTTTVSEEMR